MSFFDLKIGESIAEKVSEEDDEVDFVIIKKHFAYVQTYSRNFHKLLEELDDLYAKGFTGFFVELDKGIILKNAQKSEVKK